MKLRGEGVRPGSILHHGADALPQTRADTVGPTSPPATPTPGPPWPCVQFVVDASISLTRQKPRDLRNEVLLPKYSTRGFAHSWC